MSKVTLPKTYRAAVVAQPGAKFEIQELPLPTVNDGEVLIQVYACGICHGDKVIADGHLPDLKFPLVVGHEVAGIVVDVHPSAKLWKVGDRVAVGWAGGHCFSCNNCRHGDFTLCDIGGTLATGSKVPGGYAEYMKARWEAVARIPDSLSFSDAAPLVCAGLTVYNSLRNMQALPGSLVAVVGIGGLGHLAIQFAHRCGFNVVAVTTSDDKKELAMQLGANHVINSKTSDVAKELKKLGGARVILSTSTDASSYTPLVGGLGVNGVLLCVGFPHQPVPVMIPQLIMARSSVKGWPSGSAIDSEDTMKFAALTKVKPTNEEFPFEKVQEAFDRMVNNEARFRSVLVFKHSN